MLSTGDTLNGVFTDEWSGIITNTGMEFLMPDRTSSNGGRVSSFSSPTSVSTNILIARSNLSERMQRSINNLWITLSSEPSVSIGSGCISGRSLLYQSLHGPGWEAMWVQILSKGPLRLETARISSHACGAIQLGWRRVGSKSESTGTGEDIVPVIKCKGRVSS